MKFSIAQLMFANELCFVEDFKRVYAESAKGTGLEEFAGIMLMAFRQTHKCNLISWIHSYSRADLERGMGAVIDKMIIALIGDYQG